MNRVSSIYWKLTRFRHDGWLKARVASVGMRRGHGPTTMNCCTFLLLLLFLLASCTIPSQASSGDRAPEFQTCLSNCISTTCSNPNELLQGKGLALRLTRWTCADDCAYTCMHAITDDALAIGGSGKPVKQYYGKWPFWRLMGMQEPASVLFSLLNLWAHRRGYELVRRRVPDGHPAKGMLFAWSMVNMNGWLFSAVFHTRGA